MRPQIVPFAEEHLDGAAGLLAARHRTDRRRAPELPASFEHLAAAREVLQAALAEGSSGVVALRAGRLTGYLLGVRALPAPTSAMSLFMRPRSVAIRYEGYAAEDGAATETYRALYAALARAWVAAGYFTHYVEVPATNPEALSAWYSLGFGQEMARGIRDTGPVQAADALSAMEIHQAGTEDIAVVLELVTANLRYHAGPPMFNPYFPETEPDQRQYQQELFADPTTPHWLAYRDGTAVGLLTFVTPRAGLVTPERAVHLQHGHTVAAARGGGVGRALLQHAMAWAREQGYAHCTVNWMTANLLGARFWPGSGFRPVGYRLCRSVDERIAWAGG